MGVGLLVGLAILFFLFIIGIVFIIRSIKRKSKIGLIFSSLIIIFVILIILINKIDQWTISKKDVISDLKYLGIELNDDFKIVSNNVTGMPERFQKTKVKISKNDKEMILKGIINSYLGDVKSLI